MQNSPQELFKNQTFFPRNTNNAETKFNLQFQFFFRCISEFETNLAGAEVLGPLIVLLILSILVSMALAAKLWKVNQAKKSENGIGNGNGASEEEQNNLNSE